MTALDVQNLLEFQSTPPREGVTQDSDIGMNTYTFQSTPPREGVTFRW